MAPPTEIPNGHTESTATTAPSLSNGSAEQREVTVLVTGFGPFQEKFPVNPSYEITNLLPATLSRPTPGGNKVRIISHPDPIRVAYSNVSDLIPKIHTHHAATNPVDLVLHIGMASGRKFYAIERLAHRDGYVKNRDVDSAVLPADEGQVKFPDCPSIMTTSLNFDLVHARWTANVHKRPPASPGYAADCRMSEDAGRYLCDYIYFNSLAWFARRSGKFEGVGDGSSVEDRPVLFLHVPPESSEEVLARGIDVAVALIEAMVDTFVSQSRSEGKS